MDDVPSTNPALLVRLRDPGDQEAWETFLAIYQPLLLRLGRRQRLQDADCADLAQDVLQRVAGAIGRWDPDKGRGSFRGWLFRVARNLVLDHLERRRRHPAASGDSAVQEQLRDHPAPPGPESTLIEVEYRRQVFRWAAEAVRRQVTGVTWEAFWRTAVEGQAVRDVAAALGLTPGAVYVARSRVLDRLRRQVALLEDEPSPEADL